jgi:hypothetical protein
VLVGARDTVGVPLPVAHGDAVRVMVPDALAECEPLNVKEPRDDTDTRMLAVAEPRSRCDGMAEPLGVSHSLARSLRVRVKSPLAFTVEKGEAVTTADSEGELVGTRDTAGVALPDAHADAERVAALVALADGEPLAVREPREDADAVLLADAEPLMDGDGVAEPLDDSQALARPLRVCVNCELTFLVGADENDVVTEPAAEPLIVCVTDGVVLPVVHGDAVRVVLPDALVDAELLAVRVPHAVAVMLLLRRALFELFALVDGLTEGDGDTEGLLLPLVERLLVPESDARAVDDSEPDAEAVARAELVADARDVRVTLVDTLPVAVRLSVAQGDALGESDGDALADSAALSVRGADAEALSEGDDVDEPDADGDGVSDSVAFTVCEGHVVIDGVTVPVCVGDGVRDDDTVMDGVRDTVAVGEGVRDVVAVIDGVRDVVAVGEGVKLPVCEGVAEGVAVGEIVGGGLSVADGETVRDGELVRDGVAVGDGVALGDVVAEREGVADGDGEMAV